MKICVVFNPTARGEKALRFRERLGKLAAEADLRPTTGVGSGRELARQAVEEGYETIVAAGGDGTLNEVLNGIGDAPEGLTRARLGVLPLGTVNVFAKELQMPAQLDAAWRVIRTGRETTIDLPWAQFFRDGAPRRRYFAQLAGAGLDSRAVELVSWQLKKRAGQVAYWLAAFQALIELKPQLIVEMESATYNSELILVGNGKFYGGRYRLFPYADLRDGLLEVTIFPRTNLATIIHGGWGLLTDRLYASGRVIHVRTARLRLSTAGNVPFHVEGENAGHLPVEFAVRPRGLRVVVPEAVAAAGG